MLYARDSHTGGLLMARTDALKTLLSETAKSLQGSARRLFMARTGKARGPGGPQRAAHELRWGRMTIRPARTRAWRALYRGLEPAWAEAGGSASPQSPDR